MASEAPSPTCAACKVEMEIGLIPEFTSTLAAMTIWQPGPPVPETWPTWNGTMIVLTPANWLGINAWRCPNCAELKLIANRPVEVV